MSTATVLAVTDPESGTGRAIERGARFANGLGASLEVLVVVYDQFVERDERARNSLLHHTREEIESAVAATPNKPEGTTIEARWGRPLADEVLKRAEEIDADLVVTNTHHHSILKRTLFSNSDWELIRRCPAPLVLTRDRDVPGRPKFMAAIDPAHGHDKPGSLDRRILQCADRLSRSVGGSLWPVHAFDPAPIVVAGTAFPPAIAVPQAPLAMPGDELSREDIEQLKAQRQRMLEESLSEAGLAPDSGALLIGDPAETLVASAESKSVDYAVMGAVSRGVLDRILIGHTAEKILDRLPCDLIVVK